jgi:hypothetical protein
MQVSKHPALQGVASAPGITQVVILARSSPSPHRYTTVPRLLTDRPNFIGRLRVIGLRSVTPLAPFAMYAAFPHSDYYGASDAHWVHWGICTPPPVSLPRSHRWTLRSRVGGGYRTTNPVLHGIPTGGRVISGRLPHPLGWYSVETSLGSPSGLSRCLVSARALISQLCRLLRGRGIISRRLKPASFEFTMRLLSLAPRLGGLHRASWVPFKASSFTSGVQPPDATAQRLIVCLYRLWRFPRIPSVRFVAHTKLDLMPAVEGYPYGFGWVRTELPYQLWQTSFALRHGLAPRPDAVISPS